MRLPLFVHTIVACSQVTYLWPAVIEVVNVSDMIGGSLPHTYFEEISDYAIGMLHEFNATGADMNDDFFQWQQTRQVQRSSTWQRMNSSIAYQSVVEFVTSAAKRYVSMTNPKEMDKLTMISWASVQQEGGYHAVHTHTGDAVVCVLYARVNHLSGNLMFHDPRGYNPPFGRTRIHPVQTGQLILFPSWLPHSVLPTRGTDDYRVIFAFNFGSGTDDSADFQVQTS